MCYHYSLSVPLAKIETALQAKFDTSLWQPIYHVNAFTFLKMPVVTQEEADKIQFMHWGLIPPWIKNLAEADKIRTQTLNARSETIFEKPSFKNSILNKRCLIPADGFFEWMDVKKKKYPHYIQHKEKSIFCFAGIYSSWVDKVTGEILPCFSIITTDANEMLAKIHNLKQRMPLIIAPQDYKKWLNPNLSIEEIKSLLKPYPDAHLQNHTVSKLINSRTEDSNCVEVTAIFEYEGVATSVNVL